MVGTAIASFLVGMAVTIIVVVQFRQRITDKLHERIAFMDRAEVSLREVIRDKAVEIEDLLDELERWKEENQHLRDSNRSLVAGNHGTAYPSHS